MILADSTSKLRNGDNPETQTTVEILRKSRSNELDSSLNLAYTSLTDPASGPSSMSRIRFEVARLIKELTP